MTPIKGQSIWSFGRYPRSESQVVSPYWASEALAAMHTSLPVLAHGLGRSYGDVCLNHGGRILFTRHLNRLLDFDSESGILRAESGVSLEEIMQWALPRNWFLPVTPGTKYVTLGGAIACDVHGKNHHKAGSFGHHIKAFGLQRSDGQTMECSPTRHREMFHATIGGLGLTGVIVWADLQLQPVSGPWIDVEVIKCPHLDETLKQASSCDDDFAYTVAWIDASAHGRHLGRGHFIRGNPSPVTAEERKPPRRPRITVPFDAPSFLLNPWSISAFNTCYYHRQRASPHRQQTHLDSFFYPLDALQHWNRLYGKRGFLQYQFVSPSTDLIETVLSTLVQHRVHSFLSVLKRFGSQAPAGLLSFPRSGWTLALDFPYQPRLFPLLDQLDQHVLSCGGALYPAKDARMASDTFKASFPQWQSFLPFKDPACSSSFWRRVMGESP